MSRISTPSTSQLQCLTLKNCLFLFSFFSQEQSDKHHKLSENFFFAKFAGIIRKIQSQQIRKISGRSLSPPSLSLSALPATLRSAKAGSGNVIFPAGKIPAEKIIPDKTKYFAVISTANWKRANQKVNTDRENFCLTSDLEIIEGY